MRTINSKGPISNLLVIPYPSGLLSNTKPDIAVKPFKRTLVTNLWSDDHENELVIDIIDDYDRNHELSFMEDFDSGPMNIPTDLFKDKESEKLKKELIELKKINSRLYNCSVETIFRSIP